MWIMYFGLTKGNSSPLVNFLSGKRFFLWFTKFKFRSIEQGVIDEKRVDSKIKCFVAFQRRVMKQCVKKLEISLLIL